MIVVEKLGKSFYGKVVLEEVTLAINRGETFVILGPSGCGKSVFLKSLIGLVRPDSGKIFFEGEDITNYDENRLIPIRKKISFLFQNSALFDSLTVGENVAFPVRQHNRELSEPKLHELVLEKLQWVGLKNVDRLFPAELSGGMRKRVALARALALDPMLILYDEPTTGLDPVMVRVIDELNKKLKRELSMTSVVVTHEIVSAFRIADRIALLYNGRVRQVGTPDEIRASRDPLVQQFINGTLSGPIETFSMDTPPNGR